jgi:outer membrane protein insertion porin family
LPPPTPQLTPDVPPIIGNVTEAEGREISDVRVVGNRVIPTETILAQVRTQRGAAFSARQAELDRSRIAQLGFFATVQTQVEPDITEPNKTRITFIVVENGVVTGFKFVNATALKDVDIIPVLTSKVGVVLNNNNVNQDVAAIQKLYSERGFAVLVQNVARDTTGNLVFTLQEARISRVELSGLKKTRASLIQRQVRVRNGDAFDASKLRRDLNRIYDLGFFEDATFKVDDDPAIPGSVIVTYLLKEKRTGQLSFGVGFDSRSKLSGFASVQENNLRGTGKRALGSLETGSRRNFELSFGDPFIGEKNASYDISVYTRSIFRDPRLVETLTGGGTGGNNSQTFNFEEQRTGGRINFTKPLDYNRNRTLLFGYRNERARLFETDSDGVRQPSINLRSSGTVSALSAGLLRDQRDLRLDPSSGSRQQVILEKGFSLLGGDTPFTKLDLDLRQYFPLVRGVKPGDQARLVLAGRVVLGRSLNELPAFEQYYVGGADTVRGYQANAQFGNNQFYGNLEMRFRFQPKVQFVGFVDAGRAFGGSFASTTNANNGSGIATGTLFSVGVGVRLQTPIGPVRLDLGRGTQGIQTHFGIGPTF